jgi:hypothetical protein
MRRALAFWLFGLFGFILCFKTPVPIRGTHYSKAAREAKQPKK